MDKNASPKQQSSEEAETNHSALLRGINNQIFTSEHSDAGGLAYEYGSQFSHDPTTTQVSVRAYQLFNRTNLLVVCIGIAILYQFSFFIASCMRSVVVYQNSSDVYHKGYRFSNYITEVASLAVIIVSPMTVPMLKFLMARLYRTYIIILLLPTVYLFLLCIYSIVPGVDYTSSYETLTFEILVFIMYPLLSICFIILIIYVRGYCYGFVRHFEELGRNYTHYPAFIYLAFYSIGGVLFGLLSSTYQEYTLVDHLALSSKVVCLSFLGASVILALFFPRMRLLELRYTPQQVSLLHVFKKRKYSALIALLLQEYVLSYVLLEIKNYLLKTFSGLKLRDIDNAGTLTYECVQLGMTFFVALYVMQRYKNLKLLLLIDLSLYAIPYLLSYSVLYNTNTVYFYLVCFASGLIQSVNTLLTLTIAYKQSDGVLEVFVWPFIFSHCIDLGYYFIPDSSKPYAIILIGCVVWLTTMIIFIISMDSLKKSTDVIVGVNMLQSLLVQETVNKFQITKEYFNARYSFVRKLGKCRQGSVNYYIDKFYNRYVAVKILLLNYRSSFLRKKNEIDLLAQLQKYKHIIPVHQYVLSEEDYHTFQIFIIMALADFTLYQEIERRLREDNTHFTNEEIKSLMTSLAQTLIRIRRDINVVHRDLKPANILHCNGEWVLCDFGDSKIFTEYAPSNTIVGTPNFMSPQMFGLFQNPRAYLLIDYYKSDVFSFGLTFLCACTLSSVANVNRDQLSLEYKLEELAALNIYDESVVQALRQMLVWDQDKRPYLEDLILP